MQPTYLYIKQHAVTGALYFGKTVKDPMKYHGSGLYWTRHLKVHGKEHVKTLWQRLFIDEDDIKEFALFVSEELDIVNSDKWLNLWPENGVDGAPPGFKHSDETKKKMSAPKTLAARENMSKAKLGKSLSTAHRENMSKAKIGQKNNMFGRQRTVEEKQKLSLSASRYKWITDGILSKQLLKTEDPPAGWFNGRAKLGPNKRTKK